MVAITIPFILYLGTKIVKLIDVVSEQIQIKFNKDISNQYIEDIEDMLQKIVIEISVTFVEQLKKDGQFTEHNAIVAFNKAKDKIEDILGSDGIEIINNLRGDYATWLKGTIEKFVKEFK